LAWTISYTESARRQLRKLDKPTARRIVAFMDGRIATQEDPRSSGEALTGPMLGTYWRYRVGDYRIICDIEDGALRVVVLEVGHRREIYR